MEILQTVLDTFLALLLPAGLAGFIVLVLVLLQRHIRLKEAAEALHESNIKPVAAWPEGSYMHPILVQDLTSQDFDDPEIVKKNTVYILDENGNEIALGDRRNPPRKYIVFPDEPNYEEACELNQSVHVPLIRITYCLT